MKGYLKPIRKALKHKGIAYPVFAVLGTSAAYLVKHLFFSNGKHQSDNFRAGASQFDQKQFGTMEAEASQTGQGSPAENQDRTTENPAITESLDIADIPERTITEETLPPQANMPEGEVTEESISKPELPAADQQEVSEESLIGQIDEVTAPVEEETEQCRAITKKGTRCRNKADSSGYCRIHKDMQQNPA